jgi:hypothetical protein
MHLLGLALLLCLAGCSKSKVAPFVGSAVGAGAGGAVGGIGGAVVGSSVGYGAGVVYDWGTTESLDGKTNAEIAQIVAYQMGEHKTGLAQLAGDLKKLILYVACGLGIYLLLPYFLTKRCTKHLDDKLTGKI